MVMRMGMGMGSAGTETETGMAESWRGGGTLIFNFSTMRRRLGRVFLLSLLFLFFFSAVFRRRRLTLVFLALYSRVWVSVSISIPVPLVWAWSIVSGPDLRSEMSGWQKCLNAITNLTFHITSKASHSHSVKSSQVNSMRYIRAMLTRPRDTASKSPPSFGLVPQTIYHLPIYPSSMVIRPGVS